MLANSGEARPDDAKNDHDGCDNDYKAHGESQLGPEVRQHLAVFPEWDFMTP
ncbi:MAG: hypothetical protein AMXMBFR84_27700 [Candidatus Hydrogenedentota bacterium]